MAKKASILIAILVLVLVSLACQTLTGGSGGSDAPEVSPPSDNGGESQPEQSGGNGGGTGAKTEFPLPDGAMNVQDLGGTTNFQVKMTLDEAMKFYMNALTSEGYTERPILTVTSETTFSMVFDGHESGKAIVVQGVDMGDGTVNVNIRLEEV
jgi:hypothetical protein